MLLEVKTVTKNEEEIKMSDLEKAVEELLKQQETVEEEVGILPTWVMDMHNRYTDRVNQLKEVAKKELEALEEEHNKKLEALEEKYEAKASKEVKPLFNKAWEESYRSVNLPINTGETRKYGINRRTNVLYRVVKEEKQVH